MQIEDIVFEPILWTYEPLQNGEFSIYLRLTFYKDVKYLGTGFSTSYENWDSENNCPLKTHPKYTTIVLKINSLIDDVKFEVKLAENEGRDLTLQEVKHKIKNKKKDLLSKVAPSRMKLFEWYDILIKNLEEEGKPGPADILTSSKSNLEKVFEEDRPFNSFTEGDFEAYEKYLRVNIKTESTLSFYLRTFYGVWNKAIKKGYVKKDHHPKNHIQLKAYKKIKTKKRAIDASYITAIEELQYEYNSRLFRSQQYFLFSYYSRGMNFTDIALLKHKKHITGNVIDYKRAKNKRHYNFKLHPKALAIIEIFRNYPIQSDDEYVFPILNKHNNTARKIDQRIESALKDLNEDLKTMGEKVNANKKLTSYVARHSFATNLRKKDVDIKIIQEALGHETELQTTTYLEEIDDSLVAESIENAL